MDAGGEGYKAWKDSFCFCLIKCQATMGKLIEQQKSPYELMSFSFLNWPALWCILIHRMEAKRILNVRPIQQKWKLWQAIEVVFSVLCRINIFFFPSTVSSFIYIIVWHTKDMPFLLFNVWPYFILYLVKVNLIAIDSLEFLLGKK